MSNVVNVGTEPDDQNADTTFEAFEKINVAFNQLSIDLDDKVDKVEGKGLSTDDFQADGDYHNLRARATTKDDVGLGNVENLTPEQIRAGTTKEHVGLGNVENFPIATELEAIQGVAVNKYMTPENTSDHFLARLAHGISEPIILTISGASSPLNVNGDYWQLGRVLNKPLFTNGLFWIHYDPDSGGRWMIKEDDGGVNIAKDELFRLPGQSPFGNYNEVNGTGNVIANEQGEEGSIYLKYSE
jgi:hypothetical protein